MLLQLYALLLQVLQDIDVFAKDVFIQSVILELADVVHGPELG